MRHVKVSLIYFSCKQPCIDLQWQWQPRSWFFHQNHSSLDTMLTVIHGLCLAFSSECITNFKHGKIKLDYSWKRTDACSSLLTCSLRVESRPVCVADDWSTPPPTLRALSCPYVTPFPWNHSALPSGTTKGAALSFVDYTGFRCDASNMAASVS